MNKPSLFFISLIILGAAVWIFIAPKYCLISLNGKKIIAELALTPEKKEIGLSGRDNLCDFCGMLFVFPKNGRYSFWMKNMNFDLDLIWLSEGRIAHMEKNISHRDLNPMNPSGIYDKVLEINAGMSDKYGFKIGDRVKIYGL